MGSARITRWKWNVRTGYREHMRQPAVLAALQAAGGRIAAAAGEGVEVVSESSSGKRATPRVAVITETTEAILNEAQNRSLTQALDAGRG